MRLRRSRPSSAPFPLDDDSTPLHSTDLSLRPPSAWRLSTSHYAPLPPDNNSIALLTPLLPPDDNFATFRSMAPSLRPSSTQWLLTSPCAPLPPDGALHPFVWLRTRQLSTCLFCAHFYLYLAYVALAFNQAPSIYISPSVRWTRALKEALLSGKTPHLFFITECSPFFVFLLFVYPRWFPFHVLNLWHFLFSLPLVFSFLEIRDHGTFE